MNFEMYPEFSQLKIPSLQSKLFGHRIRSNQTKYEYLLEFLQVAISPKEINLECYEDMFPVNESLKQMGLKYSPIDRIGLKRFIFFSKSKFDGKAKVDQEAYEACIEELEKCIVDVPEDDKAKYIVMFQNLLSGFIAANQNRSWFDQNLLPICKETILPEGLGLKKERGKISFSQYVEDVDNKFDYKRYTYMCRGGEVYYLHLLNAINEFPDYKDGIEVKINALLDSYPQFKQLCNFVNKTWENHMMVSDDKKTTIDKYLGKIPKSFSKRNKDTLTELENLLNSKTNSFEKMSIFANGIIIQMLRMMYLAAATQSESNCWVVDIDYKGLENPEVKKIAISEFKHNEEIISAYLYKGLEYYRAELTSDEKPLDENKLIKDAAEDSYRLFRKLGKMIGIIIPKTGRGMRFSLSEDIIKFLVLSLIPPKHMITLDKFMELLYEHYGMVISQDIYRYEMERGSVKLIGDLSFFDNNQKAFAQKLKDCGFLRDLSDATSIVENPYEGEG